MTKYELTAVIAGDTVDTDVSTVFDRTKKMLEDGGATAVEHTQVGKHRLAHKTNQNQFGHYAVFVYECDPAAMPALEKKVRLNKDIIRFVFQRYVPSRYKKQPAIADSPLIKASRERDREERAERAGGERAERTERASHTDRGADVSVPVFTGTSHAPVASAPLKTEEPKIINLEDIDKKLDELLQGDLTPTI